MQIETVNLFGEVTGPVAETGTYEVPTKSTLILIEWTGFVLCNVPTTKYGWAWIARTNDNNVILPEVNQRGVLSSIGASGAFTAGQSYVNSIQKVVPMNLPLAEKARLYLMGYSNDADFLIWCSVVLHFKR